MSPAVASMLDWVREITGGTATPVIEELLARDGVWPEDFRDTFAILVDDSNESDDSVASALLPSIDARLALIAETFTELNVDLEVLGWDAANRRQHIAWGAGSEDADRVAIIIACGLGAKLTNAVRYAQPPLNAPLYFAGRGTVMGLITDGPPLCPVSDPQRAFEKAVRAKTMSVANNAAGRDTRIEISYVENLANPDADVIAPIYGDSE